MGRNAFSSQTVRFVVTGGGAAVLYYGLCLALTYATGKPFWSALIAYLLAFMVAYTLQRSWTFRGQHSHSRSLPRYMLAQLCAALVASLVARLAGLASFSPPVLSLMATVAGSGVSYLLARFWVFAPSLSTAAPSARVGAADTVTLKRT